LVSEAHRLTYADYLQMPDDGQRYEIIQGELFVSAAPSIRHQEVLGNLYRLTDGHVRTNNLGRIFFAPVAVLLTPDEPVEPDLVYVVREHLKIIAGMAIHGAPDLIIEVLSPTGESRDRVVKFNRYAQVGVREYWIVDPIGETVEQFRLCRQQVRGDRA
jgi:Uma2 family endonuclease